MSDEAQYIYEFSANGRIFIKASSSDEAQRIARQALDKLNEIGGVMSDLRPMRETGGPG